MLKLVYTCKTNVQVQMSTVIRCMVLINVKFIKRKTNADIKILLQVPLKGAEIGTTMQTVLFMQPHCAVGDLTINVVVFRGILQILE